MKEMKRFENLQDKFTIICKNCYAEVTPYVHECGKCGYSIGARCSRCENKYSSHDFNMRLATYNEEGEEVHSIPIPNVPIKK